MKGRRINGVLVLLAAAGAMLYLMRRAKGAGTAGGSRITPAVQPPFTGQDFIGLDPVAQELLDQELAARGPNSQAPVAPGDDFYFNQDGILTIVIREARG